jgi:hypothetical protein
MFGSVLGEMVALLVLSGFVTVILALGARSHGAPLKHDLK